VVAVSLAGAWLLASMPAIAGAARGSYVAIGDSISAGFGASSPENSFFGRYCAYLQAAKLVQACQNFAQPGATSGDALLPGGQVQKAVSYLSTRKRRAVITILLGGDDLLFGSQCQPVTASTCEFATNFSAILTRLRSAMRAVHKRVLIQVLEYYNADIGNPFGDPAAAPLVASLLLGRDGRISPCSTPDQTLIGLNDQIACTATANHARPVDLYTAFLTSCLNDCFADPLHPNDKGHAVIATALENDLNAERSNEAFRSPKAELIAAGSHATRRAHPARQPLVDYRVRPDR
jgi:lysophospholipase L1-like esterase